MENRHEPSSAAAPLVLELRTSARTMIARFTAGWLVTSPGVAIAVTETAELTVERRHSGDQDLKQRVKALARLVSCVFVWATSGNPAE
jgi:hypothetical protein